VIEQLSDLPEGTLGFCLSGGVERQDIEAVLEPALDQAIDQVGAVKALLVFAEDFEGITLEALWDDTKLGLRHWDGFERIAVVSDLVWVNQAFRALALLLPCPLRLFHADGTDQARRWLAESLGTIHLDQQDGQVTMALIGRLDPAVYRRMDDDLAHVFSHHPPVRLLLDLRQFDGWQGLGAVTQHLALIRQYATVPSQVAVIADRRWQQGGLRLLGHFPKAQTRWFDGEHLDQAQQWLSHSGA
jgi:hypothetical protein